MASPRAVRLCVARYSCTLRRAHTARQPRGRQFAAPSRIDRGGACRGDAVG